MSTYCLVQGGQRTFNDQYAMFPASLSNIDDALQSAAAKGPSVYAVTRVLDFDGGSLVSNANVPSSLSPESWGSTALRHWSQKVTQLVPNDIIQVLELPRFTELVGLHWYVKKVLVGTSTADIRILGRSAAIGSPLTLKSALDLTTVSSGVITMSAVNSGNPIYFDQNDVLEVKFNSLPARTTAADGSYTGGVQGLGLFVTPIVREFLRGAF